MNLDTFDGRNLANQLQLLGYPIFQKALYIQTVVEKGISSVNSALRIQLSTIHSVELMERVRRVRDFPIQDCNPHII